MGPASREAFLEMQFTPRWMEEGPGNSLQKAVMVREPTQRELSIFLWAPGRPCWACLKWGPVVGTSQSQGHGGKEGAECLLSPLHPQGAQDPLKRAQHERQDLSAPGEQPDSLTCFCQR